MFIFSDLEVFHHAEHEEGIIALGVGKKARHPGKGAPCDQERPENGPDYRP